MKRITAVVMVLLALLSATPTSVKAQPGGSCALGTLVPMGYEEIAVSSAAVGFTTATIQTATTAASFAYVYVGTNAIRYRDDGTNPSATVGQPIAAGERLQVCGKKAVSQIRFIRQSADATLFVSYYRAD